MEIEKKNVLEFIECYRQHPVLWDVDRPDYMQKPKKDYAYDELVTILQKIKNDADVSDVRRKINCLRSCYRRQKRKLKEMPSYLIDDGDGPYPYWFKEFTFMDHIFDRKSKRPKDDLEKLFFPEEIQIHSPPIKMQKESPFHTDSVSETQFSMDDNRQYSCDFDIVSPSPLDESHLPQPVSSKRDEKSDDADIFGRAWAIQFASLSDKQKIFAKKAIDDILFEAKLGTLHRHSVKINDNLCQHCQTTFVGVEYAHDGSTLQ